MKKFAPASWAGRQGASDGMRARLMSAFCGRVDALFPLLVQGPERSVGAEFNERDDPRDGFGSVRKACGLYRGWDIGALSLQVLPGVDQCP